MSRRMSPARAATYVVGIVALGMVLGVFLCGAGDTAGGFGVPLPGRWFSGFLAGVAGLSLLAGLGIDFALRKVYPDWHGRSLLEDEFERRKRGGK